MSNEPLFDSPLGLIPSFDGAAAAAPYRSVLRAHDCAPVINPVGIDSLSRPEVPGTLTESRFYLGAHMPHWLAL